MKLDMIQRRMLRIELLVLLLLTVLVAAARIWSLPSYPYFEDEILTIEVMTSIARTGQPLTEGGLLYWRAVGAHYLMALPLLVMPISPFSTRLVCVVFSVLVMWVAYAAGRSLGGRWGGWLVFLLLGISSFQNWHAAMARFYMPFQFFFFLTLYLGAVVFIEKRPGAGKWLVAALVAACSCHLFALQLLPACAMGLVFGGSWQLCWQRRFFLGATLVAAAVWLFLLWQPAGGHTGEGALPLLVGGMRDKMAFYAQLKEFFPLGMTFVILALVPALLGRRQALWRYYLAAFAVSLITLSLVAPNNEYRYVAHLFPLAVLLGAASIGWFVESLGEPGIYKSTVAVVVSSSVFVVAGWHLVARENFNIPWAVGNTVKFNDQKPAHDIIARYLRPGDQIMSTEPALTKFYLQRRADYWLREDVDPVRGEYRPFAERLKMGNADIFVDSPARLTEVLQSKKARIILYGNEKLERNISPEMSAIVQSTFIPLYYGYKSYVFVAP